MARAFAAACASPGEWRLGSSHLPTSRFDAMFQPSFAIPTIAGSRG